MNIHECFQHIYSWCTGDYPVTADMQSQFAHFVSTDSQAIEAALAELETIPPGHLLTLYDKVEAVRCLLAELQEKCEKTGDWVTKKLARELCSSIRARLAPHEELLQQHDNQVKLYTRWRKLGFPPSVVISHPECVEFLMESPFGFAISMFQNHPSAGPERHGIKLASDGHPKIKMNGEWRRWGEIQALVEFDKVTHRVISKGDASKGWNYISPDGMVQKDMYVYDELYPVEQLSPEEYLTARKHAEKFFTANPEVDPGIDKDCIIQIVTNSAMKLDLPKNWLTANIHKYVPQHSSIRIIDKEGKVYSFGAITDQKSADILKENMPYTFLASVDTRATCYDWQESFLFDRQVTSVPLTSARKDDILKFVSKVNQDGIRFSFMKQNCAKFSTAVMDKAGVHIDTRISLPSLFGALIPDFSSLPVFREVAYVAAKVTQAVRPIFETLHRVIPQPIHRVFSFIGDVVGFIPNKLSAIFFNTLLLILGGAKVGSPLPDSRPHNPEWNDYELRDFHRVINTVGDFFSNETSDMYHSIGISEWQKKQPSTIFYKKDAVSKMHILPPTP